MKEEMAFRQSLKRAGKKEHVVDGLIGQVQAFEAYLSDAGAAGLEAAGERELQGYVATLNPKAIKGRMRGLALYYGFMGNESLARLAGEIREERVAKTRKAFRLREFRGVDLDDVARLEAVGIVTVEDMLGAGKTREARHQLSERAGVPLPVILELVKLSDLSRLGAVKSVRARLYYDAGLDTPDKFTAWEPGVLRQYLVEWVERTGFDGIAPLPKEIRNAIATAQSLPKIVAYD